MSEILQLEREDAIATLTLNRPERKNALSIALRDAISDALDELTGDQAIRAVVITGVGDVFSAGFDLKEFEIAATDEAFAERLWASSDRYHRAVYQFPLPTIAMVNGRAIAGGFDLAVLCDFRVVAEGATFSHPEYTFGDVVYGPLHDLVGGAIARELCMTGRVLTADDALAVHLAHRVVPLERLETATLELAQAVARAPRHLLMRTKAKALRSTGIATDATLDL